MTQRSKLRKRGQSKNNTNKVLTVFREHGVLLIRVEPEWRCITNTAQLD